MSTARAELRRETDVAVVGGGIMGLSIAYNLARRGVRDVVVLEGKHLAWGASGRNGGGVRQQWSNELNIRLMQESVDICRSFAQELGTNIWMRQGGYLFLARSEAARARLESHIALHNRCDVPTRMLSVGEACAIVPELDPEGLVGACYNPTDGIVFPWPFLWGYAHGAAERGVEIHTFTEVSRLERAGDAFVLHTRKGALRAQRVVNATGAWSPLLARHLGVDLPTRPTRHEILSTEPQKPFLRPMVSVIDTGLYVSQSMRGEIVGGITLPEPEEHHVELGSRLAFARAMARALCTLMPVLGHVKVIRQWAGPYDLSPDGSPLLGEAPGVPGFYLCCGFVGHGFMMAPAVGQHYASYLSGGPVHPIFHKWRPSRFAEGDVEREDWNIG